MDTKTAIFGRRTIHAFNSNKVPEKLIFDAINAANQAPCHKLTFPWRFYSISKSKRKEILKLAIDIKSSQKSLNENSKKIIRDKFLNPSHLIISTQILNNDKLIEKEDYAACSCAIQNLAISLSSNGVSIKWSTGEIIRSKEIYSIVNIDSESEEIIGFIWVGYGKIGPKITRPLINEIYKQI
ncbi:nitroreductase family protein [Prochlorococcus marinus]|nr:nitroreductase family protein [Prochlorococcus marinus]